MVILSEEIASKDDPIYKSGVTLTVQRKPKELRKNLDQSQHDLAEEKPQQNLNIKQEKYGVIKHIMGYFFKH